MVTAFELGDRVQHVDGERGFLRYVGTVCNSKNQDKEWFGIEWDPVSTSTADDNNNSFVRGKHDGGVIDPTTNTIVQYFQCPDGSGSFVPQSKLCRPISITSALRERYSTDENIQIRPTIMDSNEAGQVGTASGNQRTIELVGGNKTIYQQRADKLEEIDLSNKAIHSFGKKGEFQALTPNVIRVILQNNLIKSWSEVSLLAEEMPNLEEIVLSGNRLTFSQSMTYCKFERLQVLVLNNTGVSLTDLASIGAVVPDLKELYLQKNHLGGTDALEVEIMTNGRSQYQHLRKLDISYNQFRWTTILEQFGQLPNLVHLNAAHNVIDELFPRQDHHPSSSSKSSLSFENLHVLSLEGNLISEWHAIDVLNSYHVDVLRFSKNPLTRDIGAGECRMIVIARMARLVQLNGGEVRPRERSDAEKLYFKRIYQEKRMVCSRGGDSPENNDEQRLFLSCHPRFHELETLYRDLISMMMNPNGTQSSERGKSIAQNTVAVDILSMAIESMSFEPWKKKLPLNMKIGQLKVMLQKKFKLDISQQIVSMRADKSSFPIPLDDDSCDLSYYGLQNDSQILLNEL